MTPEQNLQLMKTLDDSWNAQGAYNIPQTPRERLRRPMAQPTADAWNRGS